jgi:ATP-dependent Clp protease protease subunit
MKTTTTRALALTALVATGSFLNAEQLANEPATQKKVEANAKAPASSKPKKRLSQEEKAKAKMEAEQKKLALENALAAEQVKQEHAELRAEVARLKLEKELLTETLALSELQQKQAMAKEEARFRKETAQLSREANIAKLEAEKLGADLKAKQARFGIELAELDNQLKTIEANKKRSNFADNDPVYLADPLQKDGTLVISDRRIDLNGPIFSDTADHVTERINYFNNKNDSFPIFVVIDNSPGGSVMSGMSILKAMHGSEAPVYVVVKTFAASMAASLTTLAERSFAFPNAIILHHQVMSGTFGNLTETREHTQQLEEWWRRLANPIAKKMGISREEFIEQMYEQTVSGDWTEFADQAKKLKWVDHVVSNIRETALLENPDSPRQRATTSAQVENKPLENVIPRLNPKDMLYMYNPDGYYQRQK